MRVQIEIVESSREEEVIVRCHAVTPQIQSLVTHLKAKEKAIFSPSFQKGEEQYYLDIGEVLFFETEGDKVIAHTATDAYETRQRLYELEAGLPPFFVRISRSSIVNTKQIFSIQRGITRIGKISFRNSYKETYASRHYLNQLKEQMEERYLHE